MVPQRTTVTLSERNDLAFGKHSNILGPVGPDDKQSVCNAGNPGSIPSSGRSPGGSQPTQVFLPGKSNGQGRLVGYSSWGHRVGHNLVINTLKHSNALSQLNTHIFIYIHIYILQIYAYTHIYMCIHT